MRVALFLEPSPFTHVCGMSTRYQRFIRGLRDNGDEVLVVTPADFSTIRRTPRRFAGAKVLPVYGFHLPCYDLKTLQLAHAFSFRVFFHLLKRKPDVIHVTTPGTMIFAATMYARLLGVPLVHAYHTHVPEYVPKYFPNQPWIVAFMWGLIRTWGSWTDLTIVPSMVMKDELVRNGCEASKTDVWSPCVDTAVFNPKHRSQEMRQLLCGGTAPDALLLYVGRVAPEKGLHMLQQVLEGNPGCHLAIVGDGPSRKQLEAQLKGLPVTFVGLLKGEQLSAAYASADIFVMPSETETLGFVTLEAMASGLAVVAVAARGTISIIKEPGVTGLMYQPGDIAHAVQLVRSLVKDPIRCQAMGAAGRLQVESWSWKAAIERVRNTSWEQARAHHGAKQRSFVNMRNVLAMVLLVAFLLYVVLRAISPTQVQGLQAPLPAGVTA